MKWTGRMAGLLVFGVLMASSQKAPGQASDAALKDRVGQLVEKLGSDKAEVRDAAEKALLEIGAKALPLLPEARGKKGDEREARVEKLREALREAQEPTNLGASLITIQVEKIRLSEAIRALQKQSGNLITEQRDEPANPSFDLDIKDKPFFESLDEIAAKGEIGLNFFTGDGSIGLVDRPNMARMPAKAEGDAVEGPKILYPGPFRVTFKQITARRVFETGAADANAQFEVAWEPRLRPMLLATKAEDLKIVDDRGEAVAPSVAKESLSVVLRPDNPIAEMNVNLAAPGRKAEKLASFKVKADVTVPAALRTFTFANLAAKGAKVKQGDITVTLESVEVDEQVWKVNVEVDYPGEGPAFESYQQGLFNNRLWLRRKDGSRFEHNGGMNQDAGGGGKLAFEYLFVDAPGKPADYQFLYETPSKVVTIPLEFEYTNVPLP